ncbi:MAG: ABC transporter related protein [Pseudomonas fragi]
MSAPDASVVLTVGGIGKTYTQQLVLAGIDLSLYRGEVLALTGENGAGKSTLSKIIGGLEMPTLGHMHFNGQAYAPGSRSHAEKLGVRMVMQELNLLPTLTVAENLFLDNLPGRLGWISRKQLRKAAIEAMAQVGLEAIDPDTLVGELGIGHQQMVEIARNLIGDCHVLILDEPTAMLTAREVEMLFVQIERLQARGVAIVYISHRLEELARVAQRIAVLRDGCLVCVEPIADYSSEQLVNLMVGRELGDQLDLGPRSLGEPALKVTELNRADKVRKVSFEVRKGEIFGISGLIGAGADGAFALDLRRRLTRQRHGCPGLTAAGGQHPLARRCREAGHCPDYRGSQGRRFAVEPVDQRQYRPGQHAARIQGGCG